MSQIGKSESNCIRNGGQCKNYNSYDEYRILVLYNTVTLSRTPPSFVTLGGLILDTAISPYSITYFSIYFLCFTLQVNPRTGTSQGGPPPHPATCSARNSSSRLASPVS